jgi:hypothetical protein
MLPQISSSILSLYSKRNDGETPHCSNHINACKKSWIEKEIVCGESSRVESAIIIRCMTEPMHNAGKKYPSINLDYGKISRYITIEHRLRKREDWTLWRYVLSLLD